MHVDKFGTHITKGIQKRVKKKILKHLQNKTFELKAVRLSGIPTVENDVVTIKYLSNLIKNLESELSLKFQDYVNQRLFVFDDSIKDKISKYHSILVINLILNLHGDEYKFENGNDESFYLFPYEGIIKNVKYNKSGILMETKINNKSVSLIEQKISVNDKLTFHHIEGRKSVQRLSVEIVLETSLV